MENQEMETVTFVLLTKFYSVFQWKSTLLMVFLENHVFLTFLVESNLFKGLFYQRCQKDTFQSLFSHFLLTFLQKVTGLGWFNEG